MKSKKYFLTLFIIALLMGSASVIYYTHYQVSYFVLAMFFIIISLIFNFKYAVNLNTKANISFIPNYGLPLILLTNPIIHFVFIFTFEIIAIHLDKTVKKEERFWEIIYNASTLHILNTMSYYLFYTWFPEGSGFTISYAFAIYVVLLLSVILSKASVLHVLRKEQQITEDFNYLIYFFKQSFSNMLMSAPVYMVLYYAFSSELYVLFVVTVLLQIFIADTLQKSGNSIKKEAELNVYKKIAYKDPMTDCYNRRFLKEHAQQLEENEEPVVLVMTDLDDFKSFNDSYNHDVGDQVLEWFVQSVRKFLHADEFLIRNGGEEFLLLLSPTANSQVHDRIEDIRAYVASNPMPVVYQGNVIELRCTASFGVSLFSGKSEDKFDDALLLADELLYKSKFAGKNRISVA